MVVVTPEQLDLWNRFLEGLSMTVRNERSKVAAHEARITELEDTLLKLMTPPQDPGTMN